MSREEMRVELSAENPIGRHYFYATLELPATEQQIRDAWQRARFTDSDGLYHDVTVLEAPYLPGLEDMHLDSTSVDELNFLARRLEEISDEDLVVYHALFQKRYVEQREPDLVSVKDLINMTYGLDSVMMASNVGSDEALGQFVIENDLHPDVAAIPESSLYLLDKRRIGELQRQNDGGVFIGSTYVVTGDYELPEIYDGEHLPETEDDENVVFRLKVAEAPYVSADETEGSAEWISLPIDYEEANRIARTHNEGFIEDCVYYGFESAIPQISSEVFDDMLDFGALNAIAERYLAMSDFEQIKFKAVLEAEDIQELEDRMANVVIENQDFETLIRHYDRPDAFFYADPPYFSTEDMYEVGFGWDDHVRLRETLGKIKGKFLLSYNDCPEIRELYDGFSLFDFSRTHSMAQRYEAGKEFKELLIANYDYYERENAKPKQLTLFDIYGDENYDYEKILKESIISCKIR